MPRTHTDPAARSTPERRPQWMIVPRHVPTCLATVLCILMLGGSAGSEEIKTLTGAAVDKLPTQKLERLAVLYLKLGQRDQCRAAISTLFKREPENLAGLRVLARLEFILGHYAQSIKAATSALNVSADDTDALVIKAAALNATGHSADADKLVARLPAGEAARREESLGLDANHAPVQLADPAAADTNTSAADDSDKADAALEDARNALAKKNLKQAGKLTADALKQWPHNKDAIALRADYLSESDRPAEAILLYRKLKAAHDDASGPFEQQIDLAFALNDAGHIEEACQAFDIVIADKRYPAEDRNRAARVIAEQREAALLALGTAALDRGSCDEAERICDELLKEKRASDDVKLFHAGVLQAKGKHAEAAAIYEEIKKAWPVRKRFDSQVDYAAALLGSMNYKAADAAYDEIILAPSLYNEEELKDAGEQLNDLHEKDFPLLASEFVSGAFDEGKVWRANSRFVSMRSGQRRFLANVAWDRIKLEQRLFPMAKNTDRAAATIGIEQQFGPLWTGSFLVGGYSGGVMASAAAAYEKDNGLSYTIRLAANDPARDTLLLEAMDGRQHSLSADISSPLGKHFAFDSTLLARQIEIGGDNIGRAIGIEAQLRWHPFTVKEDTWLAYAIEEKTFSAESGAFNGHVRRFFGTNESPLMPEVYDAVPKQINRHALQAHSSVPLTKNFIAALTGEVAWREEAKKIEYAVISELRWKINTHADVMARLEYDTGGAGPNTNGSVTLGTLGFKWMW